MVSLLMLIYWIGSRRHSKNHRSAGLINGFADRFIRFVRIGFIEKLIIHTLFYSSCIEHNKSNGIKPQDLEQTRQTIINK